MRRELEGPFAITTPANRPVELFGVVQPIATSLTNICSAPQRRKKEVWVCGRSRPGIKAAGWSLARLLPLDPSNASFGSERPGQDLQESRGLVNPMLKAGEPAGHYQRRTDGWGRARGIVCC